MVHPFQRYTTPRIMHLSVPRNSLSYVRSASCSLKRYLRDLFYPPTCFEKRIKRQTNNEHSNTASWFSRRRRSVDNLQSDGRPFLLFLRWNLKCIVPNGNEERGRLLQPKQKSSRYFSKPMRPAHFHRRPRWQRQRVVLLAVYHSATAKGNRWHQCSLDRNWCKSVVWSSDSHFESCPEIFSVFPFPWPPRDGPTGPCCGSLDARDW